MLVLLCFLLSVMLIPGCGETFSKTIELPESAVQRMLDAELPLDTSEMEDVDAPVTLLVKDGTVIMEEGRDQLGVIINVELELPERSESDNFPERPQRSGGPLRSRLTDRTGPRTIRGTVTAFGGLRHESDSAEVFVDDLAIEEMQLENLPPQFEAVAMKVTEQMLGKLSASMALVKLEDEGSKGRLARAVLKSVVARDGKLLVTIGF